MEKEESCLPGCAESRLESFPGIIVIGVCLAAMAVKLIAAPIRLELAQRILCPVPLWPFQARGKTDATRLLLRPALILALLGRE
jgi:hypothetical protein